MTSNASEVTFYVVQHCQSEHHVSDLTGGWTDTPLTQLGREQAAAIGRRFASALADVPVVIYSSDLLRASQTAEIISREVAADWVLDPALREFNYGVAAWKTKEWEAQNAAPRPPRGMGLDRRPFPEAETPREFFNRVCACLSRLADGAKSHHVLLVTHGGTVGAIIAWWLGMTAEQYDLASFVTRPGSVTKLGCDAWGRRVLAILGDTSHLTMRPTDNVS